MCMIVTRDGVNPGRESERLHESALGVGNREVDGFTADDVLVDAVEVPEARWRTLDEPLEKSLVKSDNVAFADVIYVNIVWPDSS